MNRVPGGKKKRLNGQGEGGMNSACKEEIGHKKGGWVSEFAGGQPLPEPGKRERVGKNFTRLRQNRGDVARGCGFRGRGEGFFAHPRGGGGRR